MDVELVARLRVVIGRLARQLNDASTGEGLTPTQYSVLALIRFRGPLGLADLADLEGLNPTMVSRVIRVLDDAGLIRRTPDPADLRAARVEITPDGEQVHGRIREIRTQVLTDCLKRLPQDTADTLLAAVPAMEELAETIRRLLPRTVRGRPASADLFGCARAAASRRRGPLPTGPAGRASPAPAPQFGHIPAPRASGSRRDHDRCHTDRQRACLVPHRP